MGNPSGALVGVVPPPWFAENLHWTDTAEWWSHPATAYAAGLAHGARLEHQRAEVESAAAAVQLARAAVRAVDVVAARGAAA